MISELSQNFDILGGIGNDEVDYIKNEDIMKQIELVENIDGVKTVLYKYPIQGSTPAPIPPVPPPPPGPIGPLGSKSNPIKLVGPIGHLFNQFGFDANTTPPSEVTIPWGETVWFLVDPMLIPQFVAKPPSTIKIFLMNYTAYAVNVVGNIYRGDRSAGIEEPIASQLPVGQTSPSYGGYKPTFYYLVSLQEIGVMSQNITIRWKGN